MRILIVEDEVLISRALREGLEAEGYVVDVADRGDVGLWQATETTYDAIILDLMLPGMNGFVVCRELRERGITTPVMMLTAKGGEFDQAEGLDTGADDYVTKPFSLVVLLARLRALIRRGPTERPFAEHAGPHILKDVTRELDERLRDPGAELRARRPRDLVQGYCQLEPGAAKLCG